MGSGGLALLRLTINLAITAGLFALVLQRLIARVHHLTRRDPLTGLLNRRALDEHLASLQAQVDRGSKEARDGKGDEMGPDGKGGRGGDGTFPCYTHGPQCYYIVTSGGSGGSGGTGGSGGSGGCTRPAGSGCPASCSSCRYLY